MSRSLVLSLLPMLAFSLASASAADSAYTKLDFDRDCVFEKAASEEEAGMGSSAVCEVEGAPTIYFLEGDLRQSVGFGAPKEFQSFGQFNHMNTTIEWRGEAGAPDAAIVRFFIEHTNQTTGNPGKEGQVLVVHKVASSKDGETCIVGMIDARANRNANVLARQIADNLVLPFNCTVDKAQYYGERGSLAGDPAF